MYGHISQNTDKCEFFANKLDLLALVELSFIDICIFQVILGLKCTADPDWSKKFLNQWTYICHLHIWWVWIHCQWQVAAQNWRSGRMQETKETSYNQTTTIQEKTCQHQQKLHAQCIAFRKSIVQSLTRTTWADVNKIKASKCHSLQVLQCICMIKNVSSHTLLIRWMTETVSFVTFLFWLIGGASVKNLVKNLKIQTQAVWSTDRSILGRQVCYRFSSWFLLVLNCICDSWVYWKTFLVMNTMKCICGYPMHCTVFLPHQTTPPHPSAHANRHMHTHTCTCICTHAHTRSHTCIFICSKKRQPNWSKSRH